jgi:hypothetical protein
VPLPTYVTAPVAPRTHGHAEPGVPDGWAAPRAPEPRAPRDRTPLFDQYAPPVLPAADPLDRPRAANE